MAEAKPDRYPSSPRLAPDGKSVICDQCGRRWDPGKGEHPLCIECAAAWAALRMMQISPFLRVKLKLDNEELARKTLFVFIGNNAYEMDLYNIGRRSQLDRGVLSVYLLRGLGRWGVIAMVIRTFMGLLRQTKNFEELLTDELTIEMRRKKILVATDGEVSVMDAPLRYKIEPGALNVIVPGTQ